MKQRLKEKSLLFKIRTRQDPVAYATLYDLYIAKIYRFVYLKLSNKEEAEDATSEIFLRAWEYLTHPTRGKDVKNFSGFIYQVARNKVIDIYRARGRQLEQNLDINTPIHLEDPHDQAESIAQQQEVGEIMNLVKQLKQEYQEVLMLKYVEDMSTKEIADIIGKHQTAVRVILHRAVKKLKQLSESAGVK